MAEHGDNYKRMKADDGTEIGTLGADCGHHCGVLTSGRTNRHVGHCPCSDCHGDAGGINEVSSQFTSETGGVNPRGIV